MESPTNKSLLRNHLSTEFKENRPIINHESESIKSNDFSYSVTVKSVDQMKRVVVLAGH